MIAAILPSVARQSTMAVVILLSLALVVLKAGVWLMPNIHAQFSVSQSLTWTRFLEPGNHYLYTTYLQPALFGIFGGNSLGAYAAYSGLVTLAFFGVLAAAFLRAHNTTWKLLGVAVFPVVMVPFYWIGMDGATLLLMLAVMLTLNTRWAMLFALLLSWQHFEQGIIAFLILGFTMALARRTDHLKRVALILLVLLAGKAALVGHFHLAGVRLAIDRPHLAHTGLAEFITEWHSSWPMVLWSLCGAGWILLLGTVRRTWPVLFAVPVALLILLAASDQTRVGSIILFPTLVYWVFLNRSLWREIHPAWITAALVAHLLLPFVYVWAGIPCGSVRSHTVRQFVEAGVDMERFDSMRPFLDRTMVVCPSNSVSEVAHRVSSQKRGPSGHP